MRILSVTAVLAVAVGTAAAATTNPTISTSKEPIRPRPFIEYRVPSGTAMGQVVEAVVDRGPIVELIVACGGLSGIVTYSKVEKLFCTPKSGCSGAFEAAYARTCRR